MLVFVYDTAGEPKKSPGTVKVFAVASAMASSNLASAVSRRTLAALKVTIGPVRIDRRAIGHDESLVVVQRDTAQGERLHEHGHSLHHSVRALEDVVDPNGLEDVIGRGQGGVVPVPERFDLGALRRGGVVLPLDARVHLT